MFHRGAKVRQCISVSVRTKAAFELSIDTIKRSDFSAAFFRESVEKIGRFLAIRTTQRQNGPKLCSIDIRIRARSTVNASTASAQCGTVARNLKRQLFTILSRFSDPSSHSGTSPFMRD
jgi:hypothetical protein